MKAAAVARRYARALFDLAEERDIVDRVASALAALSTLLEHEGVARVLSGPASRQRKQALLSDIAGELKAPAELSDFLMLLVDHDRVAHVPDIREVFDDLVDRRRGIIRAKVRSAAPLSDEMLAEVIRVFDRITGKRVVATVAVEPDLIAGIVVEVGGRVYDGSVRTQLEKLHRRMASGE